MRTTIDNGVASVELTRSERRFLRGAVFRIMQESAGLLGMIERERSPTMHREATENLELSAALLAKLPREDPEKPTP